jgi:hypothetical protein
MDVARGGGDHVICLIDIIATYLHGFTRDGARSRGEGSPKWGDRHYAMHHVLADPQARVS